MSRVQPFPLPGPPSPSDILKQKVKKVIKQRKKIVKKAVVKTARVVASNPKLKKRAVIEIAKRRAIPPVPDYSKITGKKKDSLLNKALKWDNKNVSKEHHLKRPETKQTYSFAGPGTNLKKRLNPDKTWKAFSKPLNGLDRAAYHHDLAYNSEDLNTRLRADQKLLKASVRFLKSEAKFPSDFVNGIIVRDIMAFKVFARQ